MKRYVIHPGMVISRNDGQRHWISAEQLMRLYNVRPRECIIGSALGMRDHDGLVHLYPRSKGDYWDENETSLEVQADWRQEGF
jgi:hypothetical protein